MLYRVRAKELHSRNINKKNKIGWACRKYGGRSAHKVLVRKPEVKWPLQRPRHRWENNTY